MMFFSSGFAAQLKVFACLNEIKKREDEFVGLGNRMEIRYIKRRFKTF